MEASQNQSFERMDRRMAHESAWWLDLQQMVDHGAITEDEAEEAMYRYHQVFHGDSMGSTVVANSVLCNIDWSETA